MFDGLMKLLATHDTDLQNCHGQSYDSACAMSKKFNGFQAKVTAENKLAEWILWAEHSINLIL